MGFLFIDSFIDVNALEAVEQRAVVAVMKLALVVKVGVAKIAHAFLLLFLLDVNAVDEAILGEQVARNRDHLMLLRTELNKKESTLPAFLTFLLFELFISLLVISPSAYSVTQISLRLKSSYFIINSKVGPNNPRYNS